MRKSLTPLGESEMEILHHVWELGEATVAQVRERIIKNRKVAYTTVMTIMKNLNDKGYLKYYKDGNTYVYSPRKKAEEVQSNIVSGLIDKVFKGSTTALVQTLVKAETLSEKELKELRDMIDDLEDK
jgi:predicted transcriptional regulator